MAHYNTDIYRKTTVKLSVFSVVYEWIFYKTTVINLKIDQVENIDTQFEYTDHQPVKLNVTLNKYDEMELPSASISISPKFMKRADN